MEMQPPHISMRNRSGLQAGKQVWTADREAGLDCRRTSLEASLFYYKATLFLFIVLLKEAWMSLKKITFVWQHQLKPVPHLHKYEVTHTMGTNTPVYHHRSWLLNLLTIWVVILCRSISYR